MLAVRGLEPRLGGWAIRLRWPIIGATLVLVAIAASGTAFLEFSADDRIYFSKDNPQLLASEAMENTYGETNSVLFAVVPEDRDATSTLALEAALWLTEQSWQIPYATRVDSLTNYQHTTAENDDILVRDLVENTALDDIDERTAGPAASTSPWRCRARTGCAKCPWSPSSHTGSPTRFANVIPASTFA